MIFWELYLGGVPLPFQYLPIEEQIGCPYLSLESSYEEEEGEQYHTLVLSLGLDFHIKNHQATFSKRKVIVRVLVMFCMLT